VCVLQVDAQHPAAQLNPMDNHALLAARFNGCQDIGSFRPADRQRLGDQLLELLQGILVLG